MEKWEKSLKRRGSTRVKASGLFWVVRLQPIDWRVNFLVSWSLLAFQGYSGDLEARNNPYFTPVHKYPELAISPDLSFSLSLFLPLLRGLTLAPLLALPPPSRLSLCLCVGQPGSSRLSSGGLRSLDRLRTEAKGFDSSSRSVTRGGREWIDVIEEKTRREPSCHGIFEQPLRPPRLISCAAAATHSRGNRLIHSSSRRCDRRSIFDVCLEKISPWQNFIL